MGSSFRHCTLSRLGLYKGKPEPNVLDRVFAVGPRHPQAPSPSNSPFKALRSNARGFSYLGLALLYVLHFTAVKKSRQRDTFALSETARLYLSPAAAGPTAQRVGGTYGGRKQSRWLRTADGFAV
jgi:hypothetical protein